MKTADEDYLFNVKLLNLPDEYRADTAFGYRNVLEQLFSIGGCGRAL